MACSYTERRTHDLQALFGGSEPMLKLSSFGTRISSHMFALKPTLVNHTIR